MAIPADQSLVLYLPMASHNWHNTLWGKYQNRLRLMELVLGLASEKIVGAFNGAEEILTTVNLFRIYVMKNLSVPSNFAIQKKTVEFSKNATAMT